MATNAIGEDHIVEIVANSCQFNALGDQHAMIGQNGEQPKEVLEL